MMNLIDESRSLLESSGYRTVLSGASTDQCSFEDGSILGAVFVHASASALFANWQLCQDRFLGANSKTLRLDPVKSWNIYTVHLTSDAGDSGTRSTAFDIEQDFRGTRKLARIAVKRRSDVKEALLPLLCLQNRLNLSPQNTAERIRDRLALSSALMVRLIENVDEAAFGADLMEDK